MLSVQDCKLLNKVNSKITCVDNYLGTGNIIINNIIPKTRCSSIGCDNNEFCAIHTRKAFIKDYIEFGNDVKLYTDNDGCIITTDSNGTPNPPICSTGSNWFIETALGPTGNYLQRFNVTNNETVRFYNSGGNITAQTGSVLLNFDFSSGTTGNTGSAGNTGNTGNTGSQGIPGVPSSQDYCFAFIAPANSFSLSSGAWNIYNDTDDGGAIIAANNFTYNSNSATYTYTGTDTKNFSLDMDLSFTSDTAPINIFLSFSVNGGSPSRNHGPLSINDTVSLYKIQFFDFVTLTQGDTFQYAIFAPQCVFSAIQGDVRIISLAN